MRRGRRGVQLPLGMLLVWWPVLDVEGGAKRVMVRNDRPLFPVLERVWRRSPLRSARRLWPKLHEEVGCVAVRGGHLKARGAQQAGRWAVPRVPLGRWVAADAVQPGW